MMQARALQSASIPVTDGELGSIVALAQGLTAQKLWWTSGYLAGLAAARGEDSAALPAAADPVRPARWTVLYGSQTGHGRSIAEQLVSLLVAERLAATAASMAGFRPAQLKQIERLLVVLSTHGDGDPPDDAQDLYEHLLSDRAPRLEQLSFGVLALGDSSYPQFCAAGRRLDARLAELGAVRLLPRVDCDVDYEDAARAWREQVLAEARTHVPLETPARPVRLHAVPAVPRHDRTHPFPAELLVSQPIVGRGAGRDVRHIELSLEGSGLGYAPGDALGVWPMNPPALVTQLLQHCALDPDTPVRTHAGELPLAQALAQHCDITVLGRPFLEGYAHRSGSASLAALLDDAHRSELAAFLKQHQPIDVLRAERAPLAAQDLVDLLRRLTPRLYSIASSAEACPGEVHLTVGVVRYDAFGAEHWGAASTHLAERVAAGERVPVFVEPNERFRLPADPQAPIIMVGPGTGVAPFRAFMQQRAIEGARGRNWLVFGERHFASSFLYQLEWLGHRKSGLLTRLDVAFSRDEPQKVYVQHRLREQARELYAWLEDGAHFYVCGATRMGEDVHAALVDVVAQHSGRGREWGEDYVRALRRDGRYHRDLY